MEFRNPGITAFCGGSFIRLAYHSVYGLIQCGHGYLIFSIVCCIVETSNVMELVDDPSDSQSSSYLERNVDISKFKGVNYVFDERMGARITTDILTGCETCGERCDSFTNCNHNECHVSLSLDAIYCCHTYLLVCLSCVPHMASHGLYQ